MVRLELLKRNAKLADERWAAKGRLAGPAPEEEVEVWDGKGEKKVKRESVMKQRERQAVRVPV